MHSTLYHCLVKFGKSAGLTFSYFFACLPSRAETCRVIVVYRRSDQKGEITWLFQKQNDSAFQAGFPSTSFPCFPIHSISASITQNICQLKLPSCTSWLETVPFWQILENNWRINTEVFSMPLSSAGKKRYTYMHAQILCLYTRV